jgi:hypothetical protein
VKTHDTDRVREYARRHYVEPARQRGEMKVKIVAGDVHRALHLTNRVPLVVSALGSREFLTKNHLRIENKEGPPSMQSTTVTFTYALEDVAAVKPEQDPFYALRGIAKDVFRELGGGEAFLKSERDAWPDDPEEA